MKKFLFAIAALAMTLTASASDALKVTMSLDKPLVAGGESVLSIYEEDTDNYYTFNMQFVLPAGVKFKEVYDEDNECNTLCLTSGTRLKSSHSFVYDNETTFKVANISTSKATYKTSTTTPLFFVTLVADQNYTPGEIHLKGILFGNDDVQSTLDTADNYITSTGESATGVAEISADVKSDAPSKYIKNGEVVISKNNKKFNAAGARIK